jgi:hypothetical protein
VIYKKTFEGCKNVRVGTGAGAVAEILIYGSAEPVPKEIFTAPGKIKLENLGNYYGIQDKFLINIIIQATHLHSFYHR